MSVKDLFSAEAGRAGHYLADLLTFVLSPRRYIEKVVSEPDAETIRRLVFYGLVLAIAELATMLTALGKPELFGTAFVLAVLVFETAWGLLLLPVFIGVAVHARMMRPVKTAIVYALTFRFAFLLPYAVLSALFLATEDYAFAFARGAAVYAYLICFVAVLPLALNVSLRRRGVSLILAVTSAFIVIVAVGELLEATATNANQGGGWSPFHDPIGAEVDRIGFDFRASREYKALESIGKEARQLAKTERRVSDSALVILYRPSDKLVQRWNATRIALRENWDKERERLLQERSRAVFRTTTEFVDLRLRHMELADRAILSMDNLLLRATSMDDYFAMSADLLALVEVEIEMLKGHAAHLAVRNKLRRMGLLD